MTDMTRILDLVRAGRLTEATADIRKRLTGAQQDGSSEPSRPMRDVTPNGRLLPGPTTGAGKAGKAKRPRVRTGPVGETRREGALPFRLFRPERSIADAPLLVMLHGCTQTPEDFAAGTRMNLTAETVGSHVIWPEQTRAGNANGCWNWFEPGHQGRSGEAAAIVAVVRAVKEDIGGDRRVFVAGLSAGAAMAAILGARYPEVFAGVGLHSGLPVGAARDVASAFAAMRTGGSATAKVAVPLIAFHGTADRTVDPCNLDAFRPAGADVHRAMRTVGGRSCTVTTHKTPGTIEIWDVDGLGHAWSGGDRSGSYADPAGPDATAEMMRFFREVEARA